jgi:hypothetical protein
MTQKADMFPPVKLTRAEKSEQNKAAAAALAEAKRAAKEADRIANAERLAEARAQAQARARELIGGGGNGDGPPPGPGELRQIAKSLTPVMMATLLEIALDPMQMASGRVAAAQAIIDRGHGKAIQPNLELPNDVFENMDDDSLDGYLLKGAKKFIDGKVVQDVRPRDVEHADDAGKRKTGKPATADRRQARADRNEGGKPSVAVRRGKSKNRPHEV